jgi:hypothetical protein
MKISPDEPRWTWATQQFRLPWIWNHEDLAGSPIHVLLALSSAALLVLLAPGRRRPALLYLSLLLVCAAGFCALLRWSVFSNRTLLPLLVLSAPLVGLVLEQVWPRRAGIAMMAILLACAMPYVVDSFASPVFGRRSIFSIQRIDQYFHGDRATRRRYEALADQVRHGGCRRVGLLLGNANVPEYPLWVMLRQRVPHVRIEHVQVHNFTGVLQNRPPFASFVPCVLIEVKSLQEVRIVSPAMHSPCPPIVPDPSECLSPRPGVGQGVENNISGP